jgi:hypothetical protein
MTPADLFDLWQPPPEGEANALSFSTAGVATDTEMARFRLNLPGNLSAAQAQLAQAETQVQASERALAAIPQRLEGLRRRPQQPNRGDVAFSASLPGSPPDAREMLAQPEADMLNFLDRLKTGPPPESDISFGPLDRFGDWNDAQAQFIAAVKRIQRLMTTLAWIETQIEGNLLAQTVVSWTGDARIAWEAGVDAEQIALHRRSTRLALASRQTMLRTVIFTTQVAFKISGLLAVPGGQILALPVAWKYVNQILSEINLLRNT